MSRQPRTTSSSSRLESVSSTSSSVFLTSPKPDDTTPQLTRFGFYKRKPKSDGDATSKTLQTRGFNMPFSIKKFAMNRSSSLPSSQNPPRSSGPMEGKKLTLADIRDRMTGSCDSGGPSSGPSLKAMKKSASQDDPKMKGHSRGPVPLTTSRSVDAAELRRLVSLDRHPSLRGHHEIMVEGPPSRGGRGLPTMSEYGRFVPTVPLPPIPGEVTPPPRGHQTLPNRWRSAGKSRSLSSAEPPPLPHHQQEQRHATGLYYEQGPNGEVRRLVLRRNGVRFQESDWGTEESQSTSSSSGGGGAIRAHQASLKQSGEWVDAELSGPDGSQSGRNSQSSMRRSQPRRHHSVASEHMSAASNTRLAMDLEPGSVSAPTSPEEKKELILRHLQKKFPDYAEAIAHPRPSSRLSHQTHLGSQRNPAFYQPPASVYDDDPGIMSEVETSATGFRRASKVRSSLPIVRTPSKTQERPLGLVFLQYRSETKRALLPNEITTLDTVKALFVRSFPKQLTMEYLDSNHIRVYIHDPSKDMFYELEDLRDIRDRSVLRIYEQDANGGGVYNSTYDNEMSYFSEPEFDSEYQNQHIHRAKGSKSSAPAPLPQPQSSNYYGIVSPYTAGNRTASLPHGASLRPYSPAPSERPKSQPIPPGYVQTLPRGMHLTSYTPSPPSPPEKRPMDLLTPPGAGQPPPKPQRSFQQSVPPMSKGMRSTPPPSGPPPSIPSPRSGQPRTLERRHEPQGAYRTTPERPYSAGPGYHTSPERRYEVSYHSSPERRTHDSGYLSSPERRLDHNRPPFPGYSSSYDDSFYSGAPERVYGTRSGSVTPIIDEEARLRVEFMERQLASLTGLVQKALAADDNLSEGKSSKSSSSTSIAEDGRETDAETARQNFKEEKSVSFSDETTTVGSPVQKHHTPQSTERPAKPAIKSISRSSTSEGDNQSQMTTTSALNSMIPERENRAPSGKPAPPPKPASLSGSSTERYASSPSKELHLSPELYSQLRHLRKQTKDLRLEVRNLRRMAQAQAVTARETVRDTCYKIKVMLASIQGGEDHNVCAERLRVSREEDLYRQDVTRLEKDLAELESQVEELRSNVINRRCRVNMSDVESMALVLSRASKTVADLKARFPSLQESLKSVMAAEMEVVVREEKFLKEEPERLENALRRCKKLTGTLVTLKRLASVQEQRHTGGHHPPEKSQSADGPHSDGEAHSVRTIDSNPHTVIHVPPDGHQRAVSRTENALDALLDELQTFTKPGDPKRDSTASLASALSQQRRAPSYSSGTESPIRAQSQTFAPPIQPKPGSGVAQTLPGKLRVTDSGNRHALSPSQSPVPNDGRQGSQELFSRAGAKHTIINGTETGGNPPALPVKKVPPPPPPRTTSRSPLTSPTSSYGATSMRDPAVYGHVRSYSEPAKNNPQEAVMQRGLSSRQASKEDAENVIKTSAINDDSRRDQLSSNSSSSESVNSQEGLQLAMQGGTKSERKAAAAAQSEMEANKKSAPSTPPRSRQELLEQRHQELLRKQKQLQEQYARLQQLQRGQVLQRFSPPRMGSSALSDLKKTGSESNILSKTALSLTPASGSLTHLAMTGVGGGSHVTLNAKSPGFLGGGPKNLGHPPQATQGKVFETDIL